MTKEEIEKNIIEQIDSIRQYPIPSTSSLTAEEWLDIIPENKGKNNKKIINDKNFLSALKNSGYIRKNKNGSGYVPKNEYLDSDLFDVRENFRTTNSKELVQMCTVLFTVNAQEKLKPIILDLIDIQNLK